MGLDVPGAVDEALAGTHQALDQIARESAATGQLVGDRFTVADLAAAALLAPLAALDHPDMSCPKPLPAALTGLYARFDGHPGIAWVREQYRKHRPARAATRG